MPIRPISRAPYSQRRMLRAALIPDRIMEYLSARMPEVEAQAVVEAVRTYTRAKIEEVTVKRKGRKFAEKGRHA